MAGPPAAAPEFVLTFILLLAAFVLLAMAAFGIGHPRVNFLAAGLACFMLDLLIKAWPG
jgi:hypothetical protein